jgi:hypothetical protein
MNFINIKKVPDLGRDWKNHIPNRDMVLNLPDGFLDRGLGKEQSRQRCRCLLGQWRM